MSQTTPPSRSHDAGLPAKVVRKRRKNRYLAHWMLVIAVLTAVPGWTLYYFSIRLAQKNPFAERPVLLVIAAYVFLILSSVTLVLGLWYLLLAQVRRIAHITGEEEILDDAGNPVARPLCPNCGWFFDPPDRFCRHCGKPLGTGNPVAIPPVTDKV
jgi:hypothetical protein